MYGYDYLVDFSTTMSNLHPLEALLQKRIVIIDGAMGTTLQQYKLEEEDYPRRTFQESPQRMLKGNGDLLVLTRPNVIASASTASFLEAGADIIETDHIQRADHLAGRLRPAGSIVTELNVEAARLACTRARRVHGREPGTAYAFVAGSMGPTNRSASISRDANDPGARGVTYVELVDAYRQQALGLIEGRRRHVLLVETIFDTPSTPRPRSSPVEEAFLQLGRRVPLHDLGHDL